MTSVTLISEAPTQQPPSSPLRAPPDAAAALVAISAASADAAADSPASPPSKVAPPSPPAVPSAPLAFSPTARAAEAQSPAEAHSPPLSAAQGSPAEAEASPPQQPARLPTASPTPAASGYASLSPVMYESLQPRGRARKEGAASASPAAALFLDTAPASPALSAGRRSPLRGGASRPAWAESAGATSPPAAALRPADVSSPPASATASPRTVAAGAALHSLLAPASQGP